MPLSDTHRLFISYSHDSPEHQDRVRQLADRLRADGVDAWIDQYSPAPPQGWPMWMDAHVRNADFVLAVCTQTYLRRLERREESGKGRGVLWEATLIYNLLYPVDSDIQRFIPVLFGEDQPSAIPLPLRGLTYYRVDSEVEYEDLYRHVTNQPRYVIPKLGERKSLPSISPSSYPASLAAKPASRTPASLDQRHRQQLLKQVHLSWIEGVLDQSLYKLARIELALLDRPDFEEQPLNTVVEVPDRAPSAVLAGTPISEIFYQQAGALLILGGPGTGKTTLLLELARDLLMRAEHDENHPIPAVFNLSSWVVRRRPLQGWLIEELNERNHVPKKVARRWVEGEQILPLLDGLDEVASEHRDACVEAINNFRREYGLLPIAVCSRIEDYKALGTKLRLGSAVEVQPLTRLQVEDYLGRVGEPLRGLHAAAKEDPSLWELLETPLMLWVAMLAYRDVPHVPIQGGNVEGQRSHLFERFVDAMFRRRGSNKRYSAGQTKRWLCSLARSLNRSYQTIFYLESLNFESLPKGARQWLARVEFILVVGLIGGLILGPLISGLTGGLKYGLKGLKYGLIGGLIFGWGKGLISGLIVGLVSAFLKIRPVEWTGLRRAKVSTLREALRAGLIGGLIVGLIAWLLVGPLAWLIVGPKLVLIGGLIGGLIFGLIGGLIFGLLRLVSRTALRDGLVSVLIGGLIARLMQLIGMIDRLSGMVILGLISGLIGVLIFRLLRPVAGEAIPECRFAVNEGTRRSIKMGLIFGLIFGLIVGLIFVVMPSGALHAGLIGGLIGWLIFGGLFALRHLALRLFLWVSGAAPLHYVAFLEQARELLFLIRVGGGYVFVHRLLLEYFVSLSPSKDDSVH